MKKVLIITYYWPPAGGPGVQRIIKFTKLLPDFGWQPIILTVKNPTSPARDESLLEKIPENCKVYKTTTLEPFNIYKYFTGRKRNEALAKDTIIKSPDEKFSEKISRIIRANLFLPDARVGWIPAMIKQGLKIIKNDKPDIIFSTSPPHSLQLGAKKLAQKSGLKWIADFRDPWIEAIWESEIERINLISRFNKRLEMSILKNADVITMVSDGMCDLFRKKMDKQYETIYSGMDSVNNDAVKSQNFQIIYLGNMSKYQSPVPILKAIDMLPHDKKSLIQIMFVGKVYNDFIEQFNKYQDIKIETQNFLPRDEMMKIAKSASLLLLINFSSVYGKGHIPAKIFDYLSLRKPILAIGDKGGSLDELLIQTDSGRLFAENDIQDISLFIDESIKTWIEKSVILLDDNKLLDRYRTGENIKKLTRLFDQLLVKKV
ncbi:MAG: glycosyltransferase family 4 protein [Calditrichia bacterium]|jgi:glycosyltransferase involved in cell wall biosynthesis|nr:glycosyltransferase family 4 protein [Calditrichia bacterium]